MTGEAVREEPKWPFTAQDAPIVLLFGAGASRAEPLELPTSAEFFQKVVDDTGRLHPSAWSTVQPTAALESLLRVLLVGEKGGRFEAATDTLDVEVVIGRLNGLIELWERLASAGAGDGVDAHVWTALLTRPDLSVAGKGMAEQDIAHGLKEVATRLRSRAYIDLLKAARSAILDLTWAVFAGATPKNAYEAYGPFLAAMMAETSRPVLPVFTTNYDRAIEELFKSTPYRHQLRLRAKCPKAEVLTGFVAGPEYVEWQPLDEHTHVHEWETIGGIPQGSMPYIKLHGSLGWQEAPETGGVVDMDTTERPTDVRPVLLGFGEKADERPEREPFRTFDAYLAQALANAKLCIIVGFANRDARIDRLLRGAMDQGTTILFVLKDEEPPSEVASLVEYGEERTLETEAGAHYLPCVFGGEACVDEILGEVRSMGVLDGLSDGERTRWITVRGRREAADGDDGAELASPTELADEAGEAEGE